MYSIIEYLLLYGYLSYSKEHIQNIEQLELNLTFQSLDVFMKGVQCCCEGCSKEIDKIIFEALCLVDINQPVYGVETCALNATPTVLFPSKQLQFSK